MSQIHKKNTISWHFSDVGCSQLSLITHPSSTTSDFNFRVTFLPIKDPWLICLYLTFFFKLSRIYQIMKYSNTNMKTVSDQQFKNILLVDETKNKQKLLLQHVQGCQCILPRGSSIKARLQRQPSMTISKCSFLPFQTNV